MKAWIANTYDMGYSCIVFAETRGKAKSIALTEDNFEYEDFLTLDIHRFKKADSAYHNYPVMDWNNESDRLFLVKECGFSCVDFNLADCKVCNAKEFCDKYMEAINSD